MPWNTALFNPIGEKFGLARISHGLAATQVLIKF
jgi:hypothetical protein